MYLLIDEQFDLVMTDNEEVVADAIKGEQHTVVNMDTRQYFDGNDWKGVELFVHTP